MVEQGKLGFEFVSFEITLKQFCFRDSICKEPLLPDPYESHYCQIKQSKIKGAKEGLFAKRDLPKDFIVCFYNGVRLRSDEIEKDKDDWEANAYKIIDLQGADENGVEGVLDIPEKFISLKNYKASLAHKANHSFKPNGKFILFHHPRFGTDTNWCISIYINYD